MKLPRLPVRRAIFLCVLVLVAAGVIAPYLSAGRFADGIRRALEHALNRKVEIAEARFNLFRGPGFSLRRVVIHDTPAAGIEPLAYVASIEARVRFSSLWSGRLEFSSLRLDEPSVNLVKMGDGRWNLQALLNQASAARPPAIAVRGGRLNFKFGGVKSVFYFNNTDLDLRPPSELGGAYGLGFTGEPARTDRAGRGFGALRGRARWRPSSVTGGDLDLDLELDRTSLGELVALLHGHDIGVHGQVGGRATFRGPVSDLEVTCALQLADIHRWDLLPPYAQGGSLRFRGKLDLLSQSLDVETVSSANSTLGVRFRAFDFLARPRWLVFLTFNRFPAGPLVDVARHMGVPLAETVQVDGSVLGVVSYSAGSLQGSVSLGGASLKMPGAPEVRLEEAQLTLDTNHAKLSPALISLADGETARLEFDYLFDKQGLDLKLTTDAMRIAALRTDARSLPGWPTPEFATQLREGSWRGWLRYRGEGGTPGRWSGAIQLRNAPVVLPGLSQALVLETADIRFQGDRLSADGLRASLGELELRGEYRYRPGADRPHLLSCRTARLQASELEKLMEPTLRRSQGFLSRTLRRRVLVPDWLAERRAEGTVEIGTLTVAGKSFESVRLKFFWDGPDFDVPRFQARVDGGLAEGHLTADFRGRLPVYKIEGRIQSAAWKDGRLDGDGSIITSGFGESLYSNLTAEGSFFAQSVALGQDFRVRALSGSWGLRWDRGQPRAQLSDVRLADGQEVFTGQGLTLESEQSQIDLWHGEKRLRLAGGLRPVRLDAVER